MKVAFCGIPVLASHCLVPPKTVFSSPGNCVAGFTAAGAGVGATAGAWAGGGIGGAGGAAGGTLVAPGVGTIGGGVLGAEAGAAGGALVGGGLGAGAGYLLGNIVCSSSNGGGGGATNHGNQRYGERNISQQDVDQAIESAKETGQVSTKIGKYGTPQNVYNGSNGLTVVVETAGRNAGKVITAWWR